MSSLSASARAASSRVRNRCWASARVSVVSYIRTAQTGRELTTIVRTQLCPFLFAWTGALDRKQEKSTRLACMRPVTFSFPEKRQLQIPPHHDNLPSQTDWCFRRKIKSELHPKGNNIKERMQQ